MLFFVCIIQQKEREKKSSKNKTSDAQQYTTTKKHQLVETIVHWICTCILLRNISVFHLLVFPRLFSIYYFFLPILLPFSFFCVSLAMCLHFFLPLFDIKCTVMCSMHEAYYGILSMPYLNRANIINVWLFRTKAKRWTEEKTWSNPTKINTHTSRRFRSIQ